ncbi:phage terminase large subunit family protein, partial [Erwinia amylovora]|uniref:phage terminase large subunit family protein n=1 Tax=Erwinia amylovora TaxID=552 RepID=UPI0020C08B1F
PEIGQWRTSRTPYLRQIMDVCSASHPARIIDLMKATQIGGTAAAENIIGYYSHYPQSGMIVLPSKDVAKEWSEFRFNGLFENTKCLEGLLTET